MCVGRVPELRLIAAALVTSLAAIGVDLGICTEREDQLAGGSSFGIVSVGGLFGIGVRLARPVAGFAVHWRVVVGRDGGVPRLAILTGFGFVAGAAPVRAHMCAVSRSRGNSRRDRGRLHCRGTGLRCGSGAEYQGETDSPGHAASLFPAG